MPKRTLHALNIIFLAVLTFSLPAHSALPTYMQNSIDQEAINQYIEEHRDISPMVVRIDYHNHKVYLGNDCTLIFERAFRFRLPGWVGGAAPLQYDRTECLESDSFNILDFE